MRGQSKPSLPMTGGCSCGAIRYEITSFPLLLYTCNCTDCQTTSGSAFALNMPVATKGFRITKGEPKGWHHRSPAAPGLFLVLRRLRRAHLRRAQDGPDAMNLRAGTLDDTHMA